MVGAGQVIAVTGDVNWPSRLGTDCFNAGDPDCAEALRAASDGTRLRPEMAGSVPALELSLRRERHSAPRSTAGWHGIRPIQQVGWSARSGP